MNDEAVLRVREFLGSWLDYRARQVDLPGFSVAVGRYDRILFSRAYGLACIETAEPLTIDHIFAIGSQTKMLTAVAVLQLVANKKLGLDEPLDTYLSWACKHPDPRFASVTIRQLLSHGAGLVRDGQETDYWQLHKPFPSVTELRRTALAARLQWHPGARLKYSNLGYALLGEIVQTITRQAFAEYVTRQVLRPLGLQAGITFQPNLGKLATNYGAPYHGRRLPGAPLEPSYAFAPVIGAYATPEQMCQFAAACGFGGALLSDAQKQLAYTVQQTVKEGYDAGMEFGLGFEMWEMGGRRVVGHSGHVAGYVSATFFEPDTGLSVAVMGNARDVPATHITRGIFEAIDHFDQYCAQPMPPGRARLNTRVFNPLASVEIVAGKNKIVAIDPDDWSPFSWAEELQQLTPTTLRIVTKGSVFNEGELIRYRFKGDAVQAIRYAGFTLFPEHEHRNAMRTSLGMGLPGPALSLEELQQLDIRIGRILAVTPDKKRPGTYRITADFGPHLGRHSAFVAQLPAGDLLGQLILGAVYPLWNFGQPAPAVLILGIAPQNPSDGLLLPGALLPLAADPRQPHIVPKQLYWKHAHNHLDRMHRHFFKLEALPAYTLADSEAGSSAEAWLQGKFNKARALMRAEQQQPPAWIRFLCRKSFQSFTRIRIIDKDPTPYLQWELEYYQQVQIPLLNETIFLVPRNKLQNLQLPSGDIAIGDDKLVMLNNFQNDHLTHGTFYDAQQGHDIQKFIELKSQLLQLAQRHGQKL